MTKKLIVAAALAASLAAPAAHAFIKGGIQIDTPLTSGQFFVDVKNPFGF